MAKTNIITLSIEKPREIYGSPIFSIRPNPATHKINVKLSNLNVEIVEYNIFSILGLNVINRIGRNEEIFDVEKLPKGVYIIIANYGYGTVTKRMILR